MDAETERSILAEIEAARARNDGAQLDGGEPLSSDVYVADPRYAAEVERVFWRSWVPVARSREIAPNAWLHRTIQGAEIVITRDAAGELRAFHNTCVHRGAALVAADGCGKRLVCPFHGWTYDLDGRVASAAEGRSLPVASAPDRLRLGAVKVGQAWGWIWVNLAPDAPPLDAYLGPNLAGELQNWRLEDAEYRGQIVRDWDVGWKLVVEVFLEPYHFPFVHRRSVNPVVRYQQVVSACWGDHSRMLLPLRDPRLFEPEGAYGRVAAEVGVSILPGLNALQRASNSVFFVWPSTVINLLPNHITLFRTIPLGADRTRVTIDVFGPPTDAEGLGSTPRDEAQRAFWDKLVVGYAPLLEEDLGAATLARRGLTGPFKPPLTLTNFDARIRHFRSNLEAWLAR